VETLDLLYVHRPRGAYDPVETLPALDRLVDEEVVREVGVSNFEVDQLDRAIDTLDAPLAAHQTELHPCSTGRNFWSTPASTGTRSSPTRRWRAVE